MMRWSIRRRLLEVSHEDQDVMKSTYVRVGLTFAAATALGLFFATNLYLLYNDGRNPPLAWARAARSQLVNWYLWALLVFPVVRWARRFPFRRRSLGRAIAAHLPAAMLVSGLQILLQSTWFWGVEGDTHTLADWLRSLRFLFFLNFHWNILIYAGILGFVHAWDLYVQSRDRELRAAQLEARLTQARLGALEAQLHPHFLFNTLNAIATLIHEDPAAAERMITRLADLLRLVLRRELGQRVRLADELEFARMYLEIEQVRFHDRLQIRWAVDDSAKQAVVPSLLLQPLVENAIRHGVARTIGPCRVEIAARGEGDRLHIEVVDNGPGAGCDAGSPPGSGLGLRNIRERLAQLFGERYSLDLGPSSGGGCAVHVSIPFSTVENGAGACDESNGPNADRGR